MKLGADCNESLDRTVLHGTLFDLRTEGTFAKNVNFAGSGREGQSFGPLSRKELRSAMSFDRQRDHTVARQIIKLSSPEKVVCLQSQTYVAFLYSLQRKLL